MNSALVISPHPIIAAAGRQVIDSPFTEGETIAEYLQRMEVVIDFPAILTLNGVVVPPERWGVICPRPGQLLQVRAVVQGDGGSDVGRVLMTLVVMWAAAYTGGLAGSAYGQMAGAAMSAATMYAGMSLVNSIAPLPQPDLTGSQGIGSDSPTYAITGGSNMARPYEPLPLLYGTHRMYPDVAAKSFTEFAGDDQFIYLAYNFGLGDIEVDQDSFKIGDTPLSDFDGVEIYVSGADGIIPNFPGNVDSISGDELTAEAGWITRTSSDNTTGLEVDLAGSVLYAGELGAASYAVVFDIEYRRLNGPAGDPLADWQSYGDTITYTHYWSLGYWDGPVWVQKRYNAEPFENFTDGAATGTTYTEYQDQNGIPFTYLKTEIYRWRPYSEIEVIGGYWKGAFTEPAPPRMREEYGVIIRNDNREPVRRTYRIARLPEGQYEVRVMRTSPAETDERAISEVTWSQLRSMQVDNGYYEGQTRFGLHIKASSQLSGQIDKFNAMVSRRVLVWNGSAWVRAVSSNPAWLFLDFALGLNDANGKRVFGVAFTPEEIDIDLIKEWGAFCDSNSLTFNGIIDRAMSAAQVLDAIAACGRAVRSMGTGKLGVVYEYANAPVVATFGMPNIKTGSFSVDYVSESLADAVEVSFVNAETGYQPDTVTANMPGVSSPVNPAKLELFGCTDKDAAGRFANLMAARNLYQRRKITFETDVEGLAVQRGEVVMLSHDVTAWGKSGRLVAGTTTQLTLDKAVPFTLDATHYITVVQPNGTMSDHTVTYQVGEAEEITITPALATAPDADRPIDYKWIFSDTAAPGKRVKVSEIKPINENAVRITCFDDEPAYYDAEDGLYSYTPPTPSSYLTPRVTSITIDEDLLDLSGLSRVHIVCDTEGAVEWIELRVQYNSGEWKNLGRITGNSHALDLRQGTYLRVEATPVAIVTTNTVQKSQATYTVQGTQGQLLDVVDFSVSASGGFALATWQQHTHASVRNGGHIRIRHSNKTSGQKWSDGTDIGPAVPGSATSAMLPLLAGTYMARAVDASGNLSPNAVFAVTTVPNVINYNAVAVIDEAADGFVGSKVNVVYIDGGVKLEGASTIDEMTANIDEWDYLDSLGGILSSGQYQFANTFDLGGIYSSRVTANIDALAYDANDLIDARGTIDSWPSVDGDNVDDAGVRLQIRTTEDDPAGTPTWSEWKAFTIGDYLARAMEFRLLLSSAATNHNVNVSGLSVTVDMPDRVEGEQGITVPSGGLALSYTNPFRVAPALGITILDMQAGDVIDINSETENGATVQINNGGSGVQRTINWLAKGYGQKI